MPPEERMYTLKELQEISNILKHDTAGNVASTQVAHGPAYAGLPSAGLFSRPGSRPDMFGTELMPAGLMDVLPIKMTNITNPEYDILGGRTGPRGSNATSFCTTGPKAGYATLCTQVARFGEMMMETDNAVIVKTGGRVNFADTDRKLLNPQSIPSYLPDILRRATNFNTLDWMQLYGVAIQMMRTLESVVFTGNHALSPANAEIGFIKEFDGLDQLVKTGHVDAPTDTACEFADSIIVDWGDTPINENVDGDSIVQALAGAIYELVQMAEDQGMGATTWALLMHPDMFYALTRIWPCLDMLAGCDLVIDGVANLNASNNISADMQRKLQSDMYTGRYLPVDGKSIPVITSRGIPLTDSGNGFSGPFYVVPMTVLGGYETLYLEGFKQDNPEALAWATLAGSDGVAFFNDGLYALASSRTKFCMEYALASQPRLILETPWLAAAFQGVNFRLNRYSRSNRPGDPYYKGGGVTIRYSEKLYS